MNTITETKLNLNDIPAEQEFGNDPTRVRETDHYQKEYVKSFVDQWDELIDWDSRSASEGDFFVRILRERGAQRILDVAAGTGFHSVRLLEAGFDVVSADGSPEMLAKAFDNARRRGHVLNTVCADWRWLNQDVHGEFDAVICLGNSFTHLFNERDRRKTLAEFYAALKYDGILILDQRNYDDMVDCGYSSKHAYYYCGDNVKVEPDHVDEGLARLKYSFPDGGEYFLNMFPLRKNYTRRLMHEVGFQSITTYGDFQEVYKEEDPDFFVHVAEKSYIAHDPSDTKHTQGYSATVESARQYYNSTDADAFYNQLWGGEDIHVGLYADADDSVRKASNRTIERMAAMSSQLDDDARVLDVGSGYGGAARHLARNYDCQVVGLNLSEVENQRAREINEQRQLGHLVDILDGSFEDIPFPPNAFDIVWSHDSLLHAGNRERAVEEISRVLKSGGEFIFSDPMMADDCPPDALAPILQRIGLDSMGSPRFYKETAAQFGLAFLGYENHTDQLIIHYQHILDAVNELENDLGKTISAEYIEGQKTGLRHWIEAGRAGRLAWGLFHFRKR
ncbi:MAG: methyltransferase domain-containing protein [Verrucomicrobiota bacterium]